MKQKHKSFLLWFDRILAQGLLRQVMLLVALMALMFVVSFLLLTFSGSDWIAYCRENNISKWAFPFYLLIIPDAFDNFCRSEVVGSLPVFFACIIYIIGVILFTGMIISVMTNMIERRVENHKHGLIHYLESGHYVMMGYDEIMPSFIHHVFQKDKEAYVLILTSARVADVTEKLRKSFGAEQMKRIIINYGHRTSPESYKDIHLESAEQIFVIGRRSHPAHDAINVECVDSICKYFKQRNILTLPQSITCVFNDLDTYAAFKTTEIFGEVAALGMEFHPYNFYNEWAKQVFVKRYHVDMGNVGKPYEYPAVFGDGIDKYDPKYVHLVFVGATDFAVAFAMEAAQVLHFPNFSHNHKPKTRITLIDLFADREMNEFVTRNRHFFYVQSYLYRDLSDDKRVELNSKEWKDKEIKTCDLYSDSDNRNTMMVSPKGGDDFLDVEFEFIKGDIFSHQVQDVISGWANEKDKQYLSIFLTMEQQRSNFVLGMNMPDTVYENAIPVFIRQDLSDNFVTNLRKADSKTVKYYAVDNMEGEYRKGRYANIYPFGMNETVYTADVKSLKRAKLINYLYNTADYGTYKFKSQLVLDSIPTSMIWEEADRQWLGLTEALKWSNLYSSYTIRTKLATLRAMRKLKLTDRTHDTDALSEEEVEELAKVEHNRWNVEKLLMGYRRPRKEEDCFEAIETEQAKKLAQNKKLFIHHDIRPYEDLDAVKELDCEFARYIPWIIKMTETNI